MGIIQGNLTWGQLVEQPTCTSIAIAVPEKYILL